jgi:hypothetical protein
VSPSDNPACAWLESHTVRMATPQEWLAIIGRAVLASEILSLSRCPAESAFVPTGARITTAENLV